MHSRFFRLYGFRDSDHRVSVRGPKESSLGRGAFKSYQILSLSLALVHVLPCHGTFCRGLTSHRKILGEKPELPRCPMLKVEEKHVEVQASVTGPGIIQKKQLSQAEFLGPSHTYPAVADDTTSSRERGKKNIRKILGRSTQTAAKPLPWEIAESVS